ncbi:MAG: valine--tRNA ligase [Christensenellales bacterium]|nr:valine--tRNA ligase [Christensenellales bacterium]
MDMEKAYNPQAIEDDLYKEWETSGAFTAHRVEGKKPFTIVMPPPNITGQLHMGHAMDCTLQDALIRYHRMKGDPTLWLPGTDHAAIATEVKIVEAMAKEGLTKETLGREKFLERAWQWKKDYGGRIVHQQRRMGVSCDWSRERFTMDEGCSKAVRETFCRLYEKGLMYRGARMVNWCPCCQTSISDAEVEYKEQDSHFWHLLYPVKETGEMLELATTRPETMLGDTAVAINAEDPRYAHLHGCHVMLPLIDKEIPIVCDEHADMTKGTGVVKITPAHDPNDFEVGQRHGLPLVRVFTDDGHMTGAADKAANDELFASGKAAVGEPVVLDCGKYAGMTTMEARKAIVADLEALGLLKKIEPLKHEVGTCYRCHTTIEPMVSKQWFVDMKPLTRPAIEAVKSGRTQFVPERFTKNYMNWMENIRDWCVSRQLWWGHRIPVWYCDDCGEMMVEREDPCCCKKCGSKNIHQDEDVLDTWFSSALWPFSTLGWPDQTEDLQYFYPTDVLVTGYDIITFWVSRMITMGLEEMEGQTPFHTVLIHGLVRDALGRKMSKSLGNGVDPLEIIDQYGADALRTSLVMSVSPGNDMRFSTDKVESARNFANKIWNASRFVLMNLGDAAEALEGKTFSAADKWILTRLDETIREVTAHFEDYDLGMAAQKIYDFAWNEFCDWYIELSKVTLNGSDEEARRATCAVLRHVLICLLKMLHPFMPFITDAVYRHIPATEGTIMLADWPTQDAALVFPEAAREMEGVMDVIRAVRNLRAEMNVAVGKRAHLMVRPKEGWAHAMAGAEEYLKRMAWVSEMKLLGADEAAEGKTVSAVSEAAELFIPLGDLVDVDKEIARLTKERESVERDIQRAEGKLNNPGFLAKAPAQLVEQEKAKLDVLKDKLVKLNARLDDLKNM